MVLYKCIIIIIINTMLIFHCSLHSMHQVSLAVALVRKLIAVFESTEKLPVMMYGHCGGGSGLEVRGTYCSIISSFAPPLLC